MAINEAGLGNQAILTKIDKLRELSIGSIIPLPQLVVVGDQSSGKSSVLESLTGFSFPRAAGLCTRYATQITCYRDSQKSISISIIPRPNAVETLKKRLRAFERRLTELDNDELAKIFVEANMAMGIRLTTDDEHGDLVTFSEDILKIEISGPDQDHLTVIDVPGIFRVPTRGLTTDADVTLVQNMVKTYMSNSRTIILTILPCNVDIQTQEILKLAEIADPKGTRTMGVLTKPDLASEKATQETVIDLVLGKRNVLKLGYFVVKNRSADDNDSTISDRLAKEAFFMDPAWSIIRDRCGIAPLKTCLRELLMDISKNEFPHVKSEIERHLRQRSQALQTMGPSRADQTSQRLFLSKLASKFQTITLSALEGHYMGDEIFRTESYLKLATRMVKLNETFANVFWKKGHKRTFGPTQDNEGENLLSSSTDNVQVKIPLQEYPELSGIIRGHDYECPEPKTTKDSIIDHIKHVYESNRGPELGTFGGTILSIVFQEQSKKWEDLVISHISKAITLVHNYIFRLLTKLCYEEQVKGRIWDLLLVEKLCDAYRRAMEHARFLLAMERGSRPNTFNHYFNANLQKKRTERLVKSLETLSEKVKFNAETKKEYSVDYIAVSKLRNHAVDKDNAQQVCEDILDTLMSYYKVSRKRFVDAICQQVVNHFLLEGDQSPLKILGPDLINSLEPEQLEVTAGEGAASKRQRQVLQGDIERLEAAVKVLRT